MCTCFLRYYDTEKSIMHPLYSNLFILLLGRFLMSFSCSVCERKFCKDQRKLPKMISSMLVSTCHGHFQSSWLKSHSCQCCSNCRLNTLAYPSLVLITHRMIIADHQVLNPEMFLFQSDSSISSSMWENQCRCIRQFKQPEPGVITIANAVFGADPPLSLMFSPSLPVDKKIVTIFRNNSGRTTIRR
uniref:Uncharacterized protein n=1 Tax=Salix viminalis TaxID=40686 RepID=A0A6N2NLQ0_SALVM